MNGSVLAELEQLAAVAALRDSLWVYPLVNAGHVVGIGLLLGAIVALDLRLLAGRRDPPLAGLVQVLVPVAVCGLLLAALTGSLMFAVSATDFAAQPLFLVKLGLVVLGIANALLLRLAPGWRAALAGETVRAWPRVAAAVSITLWLAVIVCGRLLGYR